LGDSKHNTRSEFNHCDGSETAVVQNRRKAQQNRFDSGPSNPVVPTIPAFPRPDEARASCPRRRPTFPLPGGRVTPTLDAMKTMTTREFFHSPVLAKSLRPGQSLLVTDNGKPHLIVTKAGTRPVKTAADMRREAAEMFPGRRPKVNFTAIIKSLKK
jgi:hypothetical protein